MLESLKKFGLRALVALLALLTAATVCQAMEPPDEGEVGRLMQTGDFPARLRGARDMGNHRVDPFLLDRALSKAKRTVLAGQGATPLELDQAAPLPAPPTRWRGMPTSGSPKIFALLVDFSDYPHSNTSAEINSALFGDGSLLPDNAAPYESLTPYYKRSSYNALDLSGGVTLGWYRPAYTRATVAMTTTGRENLIKEAIGSFDAAGQDFSQFDNNSDGIIDYFVVIWTGPDNGWANFWWGYQTSFNDGAFTVDGKALGKYSWQWEYKNGTAYTGPFRPYVVIHETGHALGLPDYYDYDPAVGPGGGVGKLDMMDGNWGDHNSFSKWILEWLTPDVVASGSQGFVLAPSGTTAEATLIMPGATASDAFREFFIAQNRYRVGNDLDYPADGLVIWHVDARLDTSGADYLYDNSYAPHKLLKLMQADGLDRIESAGATADADMYYVAGRTLTPASVPSSRDYLGLDTRVNVTGISLATPPQASATFSIDAVSTLRTLTVTKSGVDGGTVTSVPAGISCGSDCAESYVPGTVVTLNARAAPGAVFAGWSGGGCSGVGSCTVTLSSDVAVTAAFTASLVLNENFDALVQPAGWTIQQNLTGGYWWFMNTAGWGNTGGSGGYAIGATYAASPSYDIELRTPALNLSGYACAGLEFKSDLQYPSADVDLSLNGAAGPWTNLWRKTAAFFGPATVSVDLSALAAGNSNAMLRFRHYGSNLWWLIDDVRVLASTSCAPGPPAGVTATAGSGQATVSFSAPAFTGGSAILGYTVTSSPPGGVDQEAGTTATTHHVTGLTRGTDYTFTVVAQNANGAGADSTPSNSVLIGAVLHQNFDAGTPPALPASWQTAVTAGSAGAWRTNPATLHPAGVPAHSGANVAYFNSWTAASGAAAVLISPAFSLTGVTSGTARFWMYRDTDYPAFADRVEVSVNTAAGLSGATLLGTVNRSCSLSPVVGIPGWYLYEFPVPGAFSGGTNYLLINGVSAYGNDVHIDDAGVVDYSAAPPTVTSATSTTPNGAYKAGDAINVTVNFSAAVSSAAGLTINLNSGGSLNTSAFSGVAAYSGTYTVGAGHSAADLTIGSIAGTITDASLNATVNPTVPAGQNIADAKAIVIDTTAPTVASATSTTPNGAYRAAAAINVTVNFSEPVSSAAGLTINLNSGGSLTTGPFGGATSYSGSCTVGAGQSSADLTVSSIAGTITDAASNATVNPTVPAGQNIADAKAIVIDTTTPTTTATPPGGTYETLPDVTLGCSDGTGSGCAATSYCLGAGCSPSTPYGGGTITLPGAAVLRYSSTDAAGNAETVKTSTYNLCTYTVLPTAFLLPSSAGLAGIDVTTQAGCAWTAVKTGSWIAITAGASGSGSGIVSFSVTANKGASPRSGSIAVKGSTVPIDQAAQPVTASFVGSVGGTVYENPFGPPPLAVTFDAGGSRGLAPITNYHWDFGDLTTADAATATVGHSFTATGSYTVTLTVTSGTQSDTTQRLVTVAETVHSVTTTAGLRAALAAAQSNLSHDLIRVAGGRYLLSDDAGLNLTYTAAATEHRDLVIEGGWTPDFSQRAYNVATTLENDYAFSVPSGGVLYLDGASGGTTGTISVDGIAIAAGRATGNGGGLYAATGGGISLSNGDFHDNISTAGFGGGFYLKSTGGGVWLSGNRVLNNTGTFGAAGLSYGAAVYVYGNEISGNAGTIGGSLIASADPGSELIVSNNTIAGNTTGTGSAGLSLELNEVFAPLDLGGPALVDVHNNIVYGNTGTAADLVLFTDCAYLAANVVLNLVSNDLGAISLCAVYPVDTTNVSVAPWFIANASSDIRLRASDTALIDQGTNYLIPVADFEGDETPLNGGSGSAIADIGADEYNPANPTGPTAVNLAPAGPTIGTVAGSATLTVTLDHPAKRDLVLYLTHADTNTDAPGQPLVTVTPSYLKVLKGSSGGEVTVQALSAARHGTALVAAADPSGKLAPGGATATVNIAPAPGALTLVSPSGMIATSRPAYAWSAQSGVDSYLLWVGTGSLTAFAAWYTAAAAGCPSGGGTCSVTPSTELAAGVWYFNVKGSNASGTGPWTAAKSFTIPALPAALTLLSPAGAVSTSSPAYRWNARAGVESYQLWVGTGATTVWSAWYTAAAAGCASGTGVCSVTPPTALPEGTWFFNVQGRNFAGTGPWATPLSFVYNHATIPTALTLIAPAGPAGTSTPTYRWSAQAGVDSYLLWIGTGSSTALAAWYSAAAAGCGAGTGECVVTPASALATGAWFFNVKGKNTAGTGPWSVAKGFGTP